MAVHDDVEREVNGLIDKWKKEVDKKSLGSSEKSDILLKRHGSDGSLNDEEEEKEDDVIHDSSSDDESEEAY